MYIWNHMLKYLSLTVSSNLQYSNLNLLFFVSRIRYQHLQGICRVTVVMTPTSSPSSISDGCDYTPISWFIFPEPWKTFQYSLAFVPLGSAPIQRAPYSVPKSLDQDVHQEAGISLNQCRQSSSPTMSLESLGRRLASMNWTSRVITSRGESKDCPGGPLSPL